MHERKIKLHFTKQRHDEFYTFSATRNWNIMVLILKTIEQLCDKWIFKCRKPMIPHTYCAKCVNCEIINLFSLVFHRKDLCETNHQMQSVFKFSDIPSMSDRCTLLVQASSGQEQYYIRSALHLLICCSALGEVGHT